MRLLLTGSSGLVGSHTLKYLIARGHDVVAVDIAPPVVEATDNTTSTNHHATNGDGKPLGSITNITCDLTDWKAVEALFASQPPLDGVIHFGAIPHPLVLDPRMVHNVNSSSSYNVMMTAAAKGIKRIVQASSVNAIGLSYTPEGHKVFDELPITEEEPITAEDGYAISKAEGELQASSLCRFYPGTRIASLRFHMCKPTYASTLADSMVRDVFAWTSLDSCASAALLGITSPGWEGHEAFNIVAPEICFGGDPSDKTKGPATIELLEEHWKGRYRKIRREWWEGPDGFPRRSIWDSRKAEKLLGWDHDASSTA